MERPMRPLVRALQLYTRRLFNLSDQFGETVGQGLRSIVFGPQLSPDVREYLGPTGHIFPGC